MVQLLIIVGSIIFVIIGVIHTAYTLQDIGSPHNFAPRDTKLLAAMQQSSVGLSPKINLWKAWLGFHLSHSLGLLMFGGAFLYLGIFYPFVFLELKILQVCSVLIPAIYVILSLKFWFVNPAVFAGVSMVCFVLAVAWTYVK